MKRSLFLILILTNIFVAGQAQENMEYFLPNDVDYNKNIPTPEEYFGQKIGEWHLNYEQILSYFT